MNTRGIDWIESKYRCKVGLLDVQQYMIEEYIDILYTAIVDSDEYDVEVWDIVPEFNEIMRILYMTMKLNKTTSTPSTFCINNFDSDMKKKYHKVELYMQNEDNIPVKWEFHEVEVEEGRIIPDGWFLVPRVREEVNILEDIYY